MNFIIPYPFVYNLDATITRSTTDVDRLAEAVVNTLGDNPRASQTDLLSVVSPFLGDGKVICWGGGGVGGGVAGVFVGAK